jgi:hypothetical protein
VLGIVRAAVQRTLKRNFAITPESKNSGFFIWKIILATPVERLKHSSVLFYRQECLLFLA